MACTLTDDLHLCHGSCGLHEFEDPRLFDSRPVCLESHPKRALDLSHLNGYRCDSETTMHFYSYTRYRLLHTGRPEYVTN